MDKENVNEFKKKHQGKNIIKYKTKNKSATESEQLQQLKEQLDKDNFSYTHPCKSTSG